MAVFYVLNSKRYRTSVRLSDGTLEAVRFEPAAYYGGVGESTYTTGRPEVIEALEKHPGFGTLFFRKEAGAEVKASIEDAGGTEMDGGTVAPESLLPDPATAVREQTVTSVAAARVWLQAHRDYVVPAGMKKDEIRAEAARRNVLFVNW